MRPKFIKLCDTISFYGAEFESSSKRNNCVFAFRNGDNRSRAPP